jgi:hypothetical protein
MVDSDDLVIQQYDGTEVIRFTDGGNVEVKDNLSLKSDAAVLKFGGDEEVTLTHVHNVGLTLKHTATADDKPIVLTLATGETDIAANDVIGKIAFQAPDEGTGTDAILVAAAIQARSEGDFAANANATSIDFMVGASEAAATKVTIESTGNMNFDDGRGPVFGGGSNRPSFIGDKSSETLTLNLGGSAAMQISGNSAQLATFAGRIITDDTTEATSTTDGSLQTDGGLSVAKSAVIGDDLDLLSDSAILSLGAGKDATLTHDGTTGLTIAATPISIDSTGELHLNSTTGDIKLQDGGVDQIAFDLDGTAGLVTMKLMVDSDDFAFQQYDGN